MNKKVMLTEKQKEVLNKVDKYIVDGKGRLRGIIKVEESEYYEKGYYLSDFSSRVQEVLWNEKLPTRTVNSLIDKGVIFKRSKKTRFGVDIYIVSR